MLVLGILGIVPCSIFTAIPAWIMGSSDLKQMDAGTMDPEGRGLTSAGRIVGIVACAIHLLWFVGWLVVVGIAVASAASRH